MTTLDYPGEFRPVPRFLLDVPAAWSVVEFPGALFAASSTAADVPWINVIVAHERIVVGTHEEHFAKAHHALLAEYDDAEIADEIGFNLQLDYLGRQSTYTDPTTLLPVFRLDASAVAPTDVVLLVDDLFTISFLFPPEAAEGYGDTVMTTLQSFRFV